MSRNTDRQHKTSRYRAPAWRGCTSKRRYDESGAREASQRRQAGGAAAWTVHPYRCRDHWHIGHARGGSWSR